MSIVCHKQMCFPPKEGSKAEILHEVRRGRFVRGCVCVCMCAYGGFNVRGPCWCRQSGPNGRGLPLPFLRMGFCRKEGRLVVVGKDGFCLRLKFAQEVRVLVERKVLWALSYFQPSSFWRAENEIDRFRIIHCLGNTGSGHGVLEITLQCLVTCFFAGV